MTLLLLPGLLYAMPAMSEGERESKRPTPTTGSVFGPRDARSTRCCRFDATAEGICVVAATRIGSGVRRNFHESVWNNPLRFRVGAGWQCCQQSNSEGIDHEAR
jgi:hypothetical protein